MIRLAEWHVVAAFFFATGWFSHWALVKVGKIVAGWKPNDEG